MDELILLAAAKSLSADEIKKVVRAWLDADDAGHWGSFEQALDAATFGETERSLIVSMLRDDANTMRANAVAYSEEAPSDARALHEVAATLTFKAAQIERGDHYLQLLADAPATPTAGIPDTTQDGRA